MNKRIEKLASKNKYIDLLHIIESKTCNPSQDYKNLVLSLADLAYLKKFTISSILRELHQGYRISIPLIKISILLGREHMSELEAVVCNSIVSLKMLKVTQLIQESFRDLCSLENIILGIENILDLVYKEYDYLPCEWNIDLKILTRTLIALKDVICSYFFNKEPDPVSFSKGIRSVVVFEKKLVPFFINKKCCIKNQEEGHESSNETKCMHSRMLSSLFVPHISIFIENTLIQLFNISVNQQNIEKNIIKIFIDYFHDLENLHEFLGHFEDKSVFRNLFDISDNALYLIIQKIKVYEDPRSLIVLYSSILYVQETMHEFVCKISTVINIDLISVAVSAIIKLEKLIDAKLERLISNSFPNETEQIPVIIDELFDGFVHFDDEIKKNILQIFIIHLLLNIGKMKLNQEKAVFLLEKIDKLQINISKKYNVQMNCNIITSYLQIFNCEIENSDAFVQNYKKYAQNKFDFTLVLKALEDQNAAQAIYQRFKSTES